MPKTHSAKKTASKFAPEIPDLPQAAAPEIPVDTIAESGPFLSAQQEASLIQRLRRGDDSARASLIAAHMPLVRSIARSYRNKGLSQEDLFQEGYMGLMRAAERYREGLGTRFSSYATWWIREAMQRALIRSRFIRLPDYLAKSLHAHTQREDESALSNSDEIRQKRVEALGVRESTVRALEFADIRVSSLDEETQEGFHRIDQIMGVMASPCQEYDRESCARALRGFLSELNAKQREVMIYRFGLHGDSPMTLEAVAERLGVSREAVRQLQVRALGKLRQLLVDGGWEDETS
ncbi:sigma-70 family RNA polymerase sigma factor [Acidithiobacillus sp. CV18-2]|uniref:Sigma-70 family RNA polymerase sigma factor n=1 Tax=Igneacidithiobacillus copahuensis TaxID=2724909 RepID=A0AAE2YNN1_9PROT|nr:sigma-70 family RNA polymerase sigma factor [Igneacidithiobacillus copahuensis]MBU2754331.1 sigma-70 family RNA polymerase sigma factor [Acidithiobacillus sp. CV18-3]MBU2757646.1 sigma-70 family RNA polymerase sigma factor [Acidithiobacillus sp. BN09-2]MBU2777039.1 sigma-70 family RNA polymerase sigma factor [Acidithiobacillus sp. CV18-2]MBU2797351.1 sigma-70 family RNA polymerase sigma factor [Acidithiobacillus sp. VAN18-2]MBU2799810.1 sigma-70 family RNA polymerase sigma factor [Acidithio